MARAHIYHLFFPSLAAEKGFIIKMQMSMSLFQEQAENHATQRDKMLALFKANDFVPTARLREFAYQYNARIHELRLKGYLIESKRLNGICGFSLLGSSGRLR